ncbi:hypothetical protein C8A01DRAFT_51646 [Parachaetomium inaequale]|uniref:Uncharacterized protein n=1 Tax=Parachaetomium inaequale TaxID=2588326 RepID=A0AAN6P3R0_9PEZI|nr:hypothetical protein C8A01DRAFT_51646 [Parachaetomium inaequale]
MADQPRSKIIEDNPIGNGLDTFRASFNTVCADRDIPCTLDALGQLDQEALRNFTRTFLRAAQNLPAADLLPATTRRGTLRSDLLRLELSLDSDDFDLDRIKPLLNPALANPLDDALIWDRVHDVQTPWLRKTSSFANSSEYREYINNVLKEELSPIYIRLPDFHKIYFSDVPNLETVSKTFFKSYLEGNNPLFSND